MNSKSFACFAALTSLCLVAATAEEAPAPDAGDERIELLDQVVPVAEEYPGQEGAGAPIEDEPELSDREKLLAEFERYKQLSAAGAFDEAVNAAKRVIEMSIRLSGPSSNETAKALSNLAIVQHQMQNYEAAQQNFQAAIDIISENEDRLSEMLINPMKGLGAAQLGSGRPDLASRTYRQAVHLTHVNEGPHNYDQVEILEALAETNLRLGLIEDAKNSQDMIYALNLRHKSNDASALVESLLRRGQWQRRTGYVNDERATYRRVIRILEDQHDKQHISLIEPLKRLGQSYFYVDTSDPDAARIGSVSSGEMYFKRAVRIADESPDSNWQTLADTTLSLADYYNFKGDMSRARKIYSEVWELLSADEERIDVRREALESINLLKEDPMPRFIGGATREDVMQADPGLREGRIIVSYDVTARGRTAKLKIVEAEPAEFSDMQRYVIREMRSRIFRPRYVDAHPTESPDQVLNHSFYYQQEELDKLRQSDAAENT